MNRHLTNSPSSYLGYLTIIAGLLIAAPISELLAKTGTNVVASLDASAHGEIPKGAIIDAHGRSGTPEVRAIAERFLEALEETGYQAAAGRGYVLCFQTSSESPDDRLLLVSAVGADKKLGLAGPSQNTDQRRGRFGHGPGRDARADGQF